MRGRQDSQSQRRGCEDGSCEPRNVGSLQKLQTGSEPTPAVMIYWIWMGLSPQKTWDQAYSLHVPTAPAQAWP